MSGDALDVIEFHRVLECVAARAASPAGAARVRGVRPSSEPDDVRAELGRVAAAIRFVEDRPDWAMPPIPEVEGAVRDLGVEGTVLEPLRLHRISVLLRSSRMLANALASAQRSGRGLATMSERLVRDRATEEAIDRAVDEEGAVLDTASLELKQLRGRLRGVRTRIVRRLEAYVRTLPERFAVPDGSVTLREGRYVIPVRREGRSEVGGIVHDESATGATLFVEPPVAIEMMNELRSLEREEAREIRRVLAELTVRLASMRDLLAGALDALVTFDALIARARTALEWHATVPDVLDPGARSFRIVGGRHPLLLEAGDLPVVPFDLEITPGERVVVVSGPNTGGKSVLLKAIGLAATLTQSGVVPPVEEGTAIPVFRSIFADIGDQQSIARSLSTFAAHLENLADTVRRAEAGSLVLLDEMGTGTDPAEGAALAVAILETLASRGAFAVVTSHLGQLKRLDRPGSGIVNASLHFDPDRMEPTYRLVQGRPGRSYGLTIARRLGFPAEVLDRAEARLDRGEISVEELLERLERREKDAAALFASLERREEETRRLLDEVERRDAALRERERSAEDRIRREARKTLLDARAEVEAAIEEMRAAVASGQEAEEAVRAARRRVEHAVRRRQLRSAGAAAEPRAGAEPHVGARVRVHATGADGTVVELRSRRAVVDAGGLRITLPVAELDVLPESPPAGGRERARTSAWSGGGGQARVEVDLRGLRVDELETALPRALDQAVVDDLAELRIIHGKGTGALRQKVREILSADSRVRTFRPGQPDEGGAGVTIAGLS